MRHLPRASFITRMIEPGRMRSFSLALGESADDAKPMPSPLTTTASPESGTAVTCDELAATTTAATRSPLSGCSSNVSSINCCRSGMAAGSSTNPSGPRYA